MTGLTALGRICAALLTALVLACGVYFLPENDYQRWQLTDGTVYQQFRWAYERIHFDPKPIDVAIVGPSKTMLGLSAARIEERLSSLGKPLSVANFSVPAGGRNAEWAVLDELFKSKAPKVIVVGVDETPYPWGHPAFKYLAPAEAIVFPPEPLLHNYFYDLAYLPYRKAMLFGASLFPNLFGLRKQFDPDIYASTRTDFTTSFSLEGKFFDMEREVPRATLLARTHEQVERQSLLSRILARCCNDGDEHVYIREIAREAKARGVRLIFVFMPVFDGSQEVSDRKFLEQYGTLLSNGDLTEQDKLYENWSHLNHAGSLIASDRLADAIARLDLTAEANRM